MLNQCKTVVKCRASEYEALASGLADCFNHSGFATSRGVFVKDSLCNGAIDYRKRFAYRASKCVLVGFLEGLFDFVARSANSGFPGAVTLAVALGNVDSFNSGFYSRHG